MCNLDAAIAFSTTLCNFLFLNFAIIFDFFFLEQMRPLLPPLFFLLILWRLFSCKESTMCSLTFEFQVQDLSQGTRALPPSIKQQPSTGQLFPFLFFGNKLVIFSVNMLCNSGHLPSIIPLLSFRFPV